MSEVLKIIYFSIKFIKFLAIGTRETIRTATHGAMGDGLPKTEKKAESMRNPLSVIRNAPHSPSAGTTLFTISLSMGFFLQGKSLPVAASIINKYEDDYSFLLE